MTKNHTAMRDATDDASHDAKHGATYYVTVKQPHERGSAIVGVVLLLMMLSGLAAALTVNGQTEAFISRNQREETQATAAAEAGLNHAVELTTTFIAEWNANGFASVDAAVDALLLGPDGLSGTVETDADNGSLGTRTGITAAEQIPLGTQLTVTAGIDAQYEAFVMDDDATAPDEPGGNLLDDENGRIIIRATGYADDDTKAVLEAMIGQLEMGAIVVGGDLTISGNVSVDGSSGGVHANGDLSINGGAATMSGTVTAAGSYSGSQPGSGGAGEIEIPSVSASDYVSHADFILTSAGTMTDPAGTVLCNTAVGGGGKGGATTCNDWSFDSGSGEWSVGNGSTPTDGTYYVEGPVKITGSPGTGGGGKGKGGKSAKGAGPVQISIIAEGSIDISGSPTIAADTPGLLFVTDGDLEISGSLDTTSGGGQMLVHEQAKITGNVSLSGQILVEDAPSVDDLVTANVLSGSATLSYNGGLGGGGFTVRGWRDVRDAD